MSTVAFVQTSIRFANRYGAPSNTYIDTVRLFMGGDIVDFGKNETAIKSCLLIFHNTFFG